MLQMLVVFIDQDNSLACLSLCFLSQNVNQCFVPPSTSLTLLVQALYTFAHQENKKLSKYEINALGWF